MRGRDSAAAPCGAALPNNLLGAARDAAMEQGDDDQIFTSAELPFTQRTLIDLSGSPRIVSSEELRQSVHAVATALRAAGTLPRTSVGLLAERSAAYIAAQLAIWQLGAAILPLDPAAPRARLLWQVDHARPSAILTDAVEPPPVTCAVVSLAGTLLRAGTQDAFQLPEGVSHVLFTSGSTGTPKAVLGSRRGLVARCRWMWRSYPFADGEVCVQKTPSVFVDSLWETFRAARARRAAGGGAIVRGARPAAAARRARGASSVADRPRAGGVAAAARRGRIGRARRCARCGSSL